MSSSYTISVDWPVVSTYNCFTGETELLRTQKSQYTMTITSSWFTVVLSHKDNPVIKAIQNAMADPEALDKIILDEVHKLMQSPHNYLYDPDTNHYSHLTERPYEYWVPKTQQFTYSLKDPPSRLPKEPTPMVLVPMQIKETQNG